jgi:hypothetical protein
MRMTTIQKQNTDFLPPLELTTAQEMLIPTTGGANLVDALLDKERRHAGFGAVNDLLNSFLPARPKAAKESR